MVRGGPQALTSAAIPGSDWRSQGATVSAADLTGTSGLAELAGFVIDNRHVTALMGREVPHARPAPARRLRTADASRQIHVRVAGVVIEAHG